MAFTLQYFEGSPGVAPLHSPPAQPPHPRSEAFDTRADALERARGHCQLEFEAWRPAQPQVSPAPVQRIENSSPSGAERPELAQICFGMRQVDNASPPTP